MKPILYTTTALAAAGLLAFSAGDASAQAKKLQLGLGGFFQSVLAFSDNDDLPGAIGTATDFANFNQINNAEVYFKGKTKLDNGISVSVTVQLEADTVAANGAAGPIDESYLSLSGGFGNLRLGTTKAASFSLKHRAPVVGAFSHDNPDRAKVIVSRGSAAGLNATHIGGGDTMRIVYFTPRFSGFGIGVSYAADTTNSDALVDDNVSGASPAIFDAALTFERKLGDVDVKADVAWFSLTGNAAGQGSVTTPPDSTSIRGGINLGFAGFTVGGAYLERDTNTTVATLSTGERTVWDVGAAYKSGPWAVSVTYVHGETPDTIAIAGDSEQDTVFLGGTYSIGPGVTLQGNLIYSDMDDEANTAATKNKGYAAVAGIKVDF